MQQYKIKGDFSSIVYMERVPLPIEPGKSVLINSRTHQPISAAKYTTCIAAGYGDLMNWVIDHRDAVIEFVTSHCSNLKTRVVFRPTFKYANILFESFHPMLLADFKKYYRFLGQLSGAENRVPLAIYYHELSDLLNLDIPYFSTMTNHHIVKNSQGKTINWKTKHTGIDRVVKRIHSINHEFIDQGIKHILASLQVTGPHPPVSRRPADKPQDVGL